MFIRVGYRGYGTGKLCLDNKFHEYIKGAKASGLKVGAYFFSQAVTEEEAREEAAFVLQQLEGYSLDFPVAYDMENSPRSRRSSGRRAAPSSSAPAPALRASRQTPSYNAIPCRHLISL